MGAGPPSWTRPSPPFPRPPVSGPWRRSPRAGPATCVIAWSARPPRRARRSNAVWSSSARLPEARGRPPWKSSPPAPRCPPLPVPSSRLGPHPARRRSPLVDLAVALVAVQDLAHVVLRLVEVDGGQELVVAGTGGETRPQLRLLGARVVGGGGAIGVAAKTLLQVADVARAELDDDLGLVEVLGLEVHEADRGSDLLGRADDELEQAPRRGGRLGADVETRLLPHDGEHEPGIGAVLPGLLRDLRIEITREQELPHQGRQ